MTKLDGFETVVVLYSKGHFKSHTLNKLLAIYSGMKEDFYSDYMIFEAVARVASKVLNGYEWYDFLKHLKGDNNTSLVKDLDESFASINDIKNSLLSHMNNVNVLDVNGERLVEFAKLSDELEELRVK